MGVNYLDNGNPTNQLEILPLNSEQATNLIIEQARQLVKQLIECRGHDKPPFLTEEFARLKGIKKIVKADLGKTSAILLRFSDGYVIKVNENHHLVRQNFSCAHEIGHILFNELKLEHYIRSIEYREFNPSKTVELRARARERLCDIAAAELLMPEFVFRKYLSSFGLSISSIEHLADVFKVSVEAAAMRIAEVSIEPCIALKWLLRRGIKSEALSLKSRVGPGRKPRGKTNYMPVHIVAKSDSTLYRAYEHDSPVKSSKDFKIDNTVKRLPIESKGFGRDQARYVISLAFPDRWKNERKIRSGEYCVK